MPAAEMRYASAVPSVTSVVAITYFSDDTIFPVRQNAQLFNNQFIMLLAHLNLME